MKEYDKITAFHYFSYRPPLHDVILSKCLKGSEGYQLGLDIGSGTGHSSIALRYYCKKVIGIEPVEHMLSHALPHPGVEYQIYDLENINFKNDSFDIITFAGSLYYAKSQRLLDETLRVAKSSSVILVYDFRIHVEEILNTLGLIIPDDQDIPDDPDGGYNHREDFSGLVINDKLAMRFSEEEIVPFIISQSDIVHLLLSDINHRAIFQEKPGQKAIDQKITGLLEQAGIRKKAKLNSTIFYSVYDVRK